MNDIIKYKFNHDILIISIILFLFNPIIGILTELLLISVYNKNINKKFIISLFILISLFFGFVNTTRIPESDLMRYKIMFEDARKYDFLSYIKEYNYKELFFIILCYFLNYIFVDNFKLFLLFVTFVQYFLVLIALFKLFKYNNLYILIISILIHFFNSTAFFPSVHLLIKTFSSSIFLFYLVTLIKEKKNKWYLIIITIFTHSSSIILFLLIFFPWLNKKISFIRLLIYLSLIFILIFFLEDFIKILNSALKIQIYESLFKLPDPYSLESSWYKGENTIKIRIYLLIFFVIPSIITNYFFSLDSDYLKITNYWFLFSITLLLFSILSFNFLTMRLSFYIFHSYSIFLGVFLLNILKKFGNNTFKIISFIILLFFIQGFIKTYVNTKYKLASFKEFISKPAFEYIFYIFNF